MINIRKGQKGKIVNPQNRGVKYVGVMSQKLWSSMVQCQEMLALENTIEIMTVST